MLQLKDRLSFFVLSDEIPFPEMQSVALQLLSDISQAESQEIFIKRGILSKKGPSVLAKLCAGVASLYTHAKESYDKITKSKWTELNPVIEKYIVLNRELYTAMAYKYQGIQHYTTGSPGLSVLFLKKAVSILTALKYDNTKYPYSDDCMIFWKKCQKEIELVTNVYNDFEQENSEIYHDKGDESLLVLPPAVLLAKSVPFDPPQKEDIKVTPQTGCTIL